MSFGTWGALIGCHADVRLFVVCGDGSRGINTLVLGVIIIVITIVVVVVLDTREPMAVVLHQSCVAEPQLIELLPQLVPLLLLLLLPARMTVEYFYFSQYLHQTIVFSSKHRDFN